MGRSGDNRAPSQLPQGCSDFLTAMQLTAVCSASVLNPQRGSLLSAPPHFLCQGASGHGDIPFTNGSVLGAQRSGAIVG